MTLHANLIDGEWVDGEAAPNVNPANTAEVVGHYARASAGDAARAIAAAKAAFPGWSRSGPLERRGVLSKAAAEIFTRKEEFGKLLSREEGKTLAEGIGETVRAARSSTSSPASACGSRANCCRRCAPGSASRSHARRSARSG